MSVLYSSRGRHRMCELVTGVQTFAFPIVLIFRARGAGDLASTGASAMIELTRDIFKNYACSVTSLQRVVDKTPYTTHALGRMQIFEPKQVETEEVLLYEQHGGYKLIQATERGEHWTTQLRRQGRTRALSTAAPSKQDKMRARSADHREAKGEERTCRTTW